MDRMKLLSGQTMKLEQNPSPVFWDRKTNCG